MHRLLDFLLLSSVVSSLTMGCTQPEHPTKEVAYRSSTPLYAHPGGCRKCHETLERGLPVLPSAAKSCDTAGCHPAIDSPQRFVHGPVALGNCRLCHEPHSSRAPQLLTQRRQELCTGCHQQLYSCPSRGTARDASCVACHEAHGSGNAHLLRESL